ncbi:S1 RNA-binding domain-containing protein [Candidatus Roizmanbacteria bacterium]|nr:S1 RNA-binding domain-containing protein [Candidatus Roizmanbacteria bacterium]
MPRAKAVKTTLEQPAHPMELLLKTQTITPIKKGGEMDATIVAISKKEILFDIGAKANAILGDRETRDIATYLPYLKPGDTVRVRIISEESREGYPVVSMQRFFERGKWNILEEKKKNEEEIEVVCGEYGKGGVFIDFMGIRGVIPKIQLTEEYLNNPEKLEGNKIKVKVLEVDQVKNRLVVSQKAAALKISRKELKKRFDKITAGGKKKAKVLGVSEFGIFCEVDGVEGLIHISEISWEKVSDISSFAKPGDMVDVLVAEKNKQDLKLNLSIKRLSYDPWDKIEEKYPKDKEVEGEIVRREKYGYFVRLEPGIEGLIHISKLTGKEDFETGQTVKAYIERVSKASRRLSLVLPQKEKPVTYR